MEVGPGKIFTTEELAGLARQELIDLVLSQASMIELLMAGVERLESDASKDSKTSSKPPSADNQKRRAERAEGKAKEPGARRGKRPGAAGHRLAPVAEPDETVLHRPDACAGCGGTLDDAEVVGAESRQVFDIPDPRPSSPSTGPNAGAVRAAASPPPPSRPRPSHRRATGRGCGPWPCT